MTRSNQVTGANLPSVKELSRRLVLRQPSAPCKSLVCFTLCGLIFVSAVFAGDQPQWGQRYSRNMVSDENRRESRSNIKSMRVFYRNRVHVTVGGDIWWGKHEAWLKCIDATKAGDITNSGEIWPYSLKGHCCSTPAIEDMLAFVADCGRLIHCVDVGTGRPYWTYEASGDMWACTLVADVKIYVGTRRGDFWVLAARRDKNVISMIDLDSPIVSTPIAANSALYIATMKKLYAVKGTPE